MSTDPDHWPLDAPDPALREPRRLAALRATGLMGDRFSSVLDQLARAAARVVDAPVALVSLVDDERQHFAGHAVDRGPLLPLRETTLAYSLCQHVVARGEPVVIVDAAADPRVREHRAVHELKVRAYAGVPLTTSDGVTIGTLCAIDDAPHDWKPDDVARLHELATLARAELERTAALEAARAAEARLRAAFDLSPLAGWTADASGRTVDVSDGWRSLTGLTPDASAGWPDAVDTADRAAARAAWRRAVATGAPLDATYRLRTTRGEIRWARVRARPERDAAGIVVRWHGWAEDVHDRVLDEREHAQLELAARSTADGLWSWDLATDVTFHSSRLREILGYSPSEFPTTRDGLRALIHPDDLPSLAAAVRAHAESGVPFDAEVRLRNRDGAWCTLHLRGQAARDAAGRAVRIAGAATDVTARRAAEAALHESQSHLALIFARATVGLSEIAADGRFVHVNEELCRIVGRTPEQMALLSFADVTHPDDLARSVAAVSAVYEAGGSVRLEKRYLRPDGTTVVAESAVTRLDGGDGRAPTLLAVTVDLTARREAEAALRESEERFRQLADNVSEIFWLVDLAPTLTGSRVIYVNPAYTRITGNPVDTVADSPVLGFDQIAADDLPRVIEAARAVADGEARTLEYRLAVTGLPERVVRTRMFPIRDAAGHVVRIGGLTEDVTEQHSLEDRLRQAQKMEAVGQLAGGVAHDFNNLLTVIGANLAFVRAELGPAHTSENDLLGIADAAERARSLVRQLLSFSRKQAVHPRPLDLGELVRGAERLLQRVLGEDVALRVRVGPGPLVVHADPGQLEQVLMNLAVNARDAMHTPRHGHAGTGGVLTVEIAAVQAGGWVELTVRDTGHGMTVAERARVFDPFFTTKAVGQGTGLGLATVFGTVSQAGGTVAVHSEPGCGATFTIRLPAVDPGAAVSATDARGHGANTDASTALAPPANAVPAAAHGSGIDGHGTAARPGATVLLVEDEPPVRNTTRRMLERLGYTVVEAENGAAGLRVWTRDRAEIDAVVTDLRMPELGGRGLAARLRAERPALPIVFMSGYAEEFAGETNGTAEPVLEKPFTVAALGEALAAVLPARPGGGGAGDG
jgi:PAS domain S-box-containing protein